MHGAKSPPNPLTPKLLDASSNSGDLPDMNSLLGHEGQAEAPHGRADTKKSREKVG